MQECCFLEGDLSHEKESLAEAFQLTEAEREEASKAVDAALSRRRISEMVGYIWQDSCDRLSFKAKVYATLMLGMDIYRLLLEEVLKARGEEGEGDGG